MQLDVDTSTYNNETSILLRWRQRISACGKKKKLYTKNHNELSRVRKKNFTTISKWTWPRAKKKITMNSRACAKKNSQPFANGRGRGQKKKITMNSRACAKKKSQPFANGCGHGHVHWLPVHVQRISREKKKKDFGRSPRHPVHHRISLASTSHLLQSISRLAHPPNSNFSM